MRTPKKDGARNLLDSSLPCPESEEEPIYAVINEAIRNSRENLDLESIGDEPDTRVVQREVVESPEPVVEVCFESYINTVNTMPLQAKESVHETDVSVQPCNEESPLHQQKNYADDLNHVYERKNHYYVSEIRKLDNLETNSHIVEERIIENDYVEMYANNERNGYHLENNEMNHSFPVPPQEDRLSPVSNGTSESDSQRNEDRDESEDDMVIPPEPKSAMGAQETDSDGYQSDSQHHDEVLHSPVRPSQLFRDLKSENSFESQENGNEARKIRNYQPKFLVELNRYFKENTEKTDATENRNNNELDGDNRNSNYKMNGNYHQSSRRDNDGPDFDATPSMEHRYANFSVNDILRQSYLPTTRLDNSMSEDINYSEHYDDLNSRRRDEFKKDVPVSKLSSLNIQNQYQYETSERNRMRTSGYDDTPKVNGNKSYGRPVMSPKTDLLSTSWEKDYKKKINDFSLSTTMEEPQNEVLETEEHSILKPKLRKTKNSDLILGIKHDEEEDESAASEDFIKAANMAEYLSSDLSLHNVYSNEPPCTKSRIPIFENNSNDNSNYNNINNSKNINNINNNSNWDKTYNDHSSFGVNIFNKQVQYKQKHSYLDADFRATDYLESPTEGTPKKQPNTKLSHKSSFNDFRSNDDDYPAQITPVKSNDHLDKPIVSIKSRIEAFSKNGGLSHLKKEIERVNTTNKVSHL